jgi:hypothetical protein
MKGFDMSKSGLIIRTNERHEISLPAKARVAFSHADIVKLSKGVSGQDGWVDVHLIDFSAAGIGFVSTTFFPRGSVIELVVPEFGDTESEDLISCEMRVMRVQMTDRRPAYLIGGAFVGMNEKLEEQIERLMLRFDGSGGDHA